jgi:peroxidase
VPETFENLTQIMWNNVDLEQLRNVYESIDDIDLFVLGLAEKPERGALIGPTFSCIMAKQFELTRHGDRFWYENFFQPSAFTESQLMELRKTSLAGVLCDNTDNIGLVQPQVFELPNKYGFVGLINLISSG